MSSVAIGQKPTCSECGASQRAAAAFCDACGVSLLPTPSRLAAKIRATQGQVEGESKQVTVMFVDIVGSMSLCERLGADVWRTLLERFFVLASEAVHTVDGTVDKFTGDGIMAIFGAPIGHEDHARRACVAALQLHAGLAPFAAELQGPELKVRVGLNSGEVVVGSIGDDLRMDYTAIGHTVGVAARMEPLAPPGSTAISATTETLVRGEFESDGAG